MASGNSAETLVDGNAPSPAKVSTTEKAIDADQTPPQDDVNSSAPAMTYPSGIKLWLIMSALLLNVFIIALDQTIVAPATPKISNEFHALADIGWYTSAYLMATTAIQPLYGRLFGLFNVKYTYISARLFSAKFRNPAHDKQTILIFELGSIVCASAPSSAAFIVGRAIAGAGLAGGYIGTMIIITLSAPLEKVPIYTSFIGATYGIGAVAGPIIGGALTSEVTWRWNFWLNLPIGGLTLALVILFLHVPTFPRSATFKRDLLHLDIVGTILLLGSVVSFLLVCQYGGLTYAWGSSQIIGLLVGAVVIAIAFVAWEAFWGEDANIPLRLFNNRTIAFGAVTNFAVAASYFPLLAFLSVWFQAVQGSSAIRAGVQTLPLICSVILSTTVAGIVSTVTGYYKPPLLFGFVVGSIGAGLLFTLDQTSSSKAYGFEFLAGMLGGSFQLTFVASQTVHQEGSDRQRGGSIVLFTQTLGGALSAGAAQVIYSNKFRNGVYEIPGIDHQTVATSGATLFRTLGLTADQVQMVADAALHSLRYVFLLSAAFAVLGASTSFGMHNNDVRQKPPAAKGEA